MLALLVLIVPFSSPKGEIREVAGRIIYIGNEPFKQVAIRSKGTTYVIKNSVQKLKNCQRKQCLFTIKVSGLALQGTESLPVEVISFQPKP